MTTTPTIHAPVRPGPEPATVTELEAFLDGEPTGHASSRSAPTGAWLTLAGFAAELGVSTDTAYKWSARGYPVFPHAAKLPNGEIRIARADFCAWMAERRR